MPDKPPSVTQFEDFDFRELPIGVYMTSLDGQFIVCNRTLRKMFELPMIGPVVANIKQYYANPRDRDDAIEKVMKAEASGHGYEKHLVQFLVNGRDLFAEVFCKPLKDLANGHVIGFAGCMVDVTSDFETRQREKELREKVEELTFDIGRILHANTTTLVMVKQTLDAVVEAFEPKPYRELSAPHAEDVESMLTDHAGVLTNAIVRFSESADEERRQKALTVTQWNRLIGYMSFLREFKERIPTPESYPATLRKLANAVGQIHSSIVSGYMPREQSRELQNAAWRLERVANLIEVLETRAAVIQMDYTIHSLREFITSDVREPVTCQRLSVKVLIEECAKRLAEYAHSLKIDIERKEVEDSHVWANERELLRALSNLLHNAIKYSWHRDPERARPAWVSIRTKTRDQNIYIEFENWGVPIKREEIEKAKVFELGYRGEMSKDRGRLGTGIGLTDARRVAESHGGKIEIESRPAVRGSQNEKQEDYYDRPFLTKVTMVLPVSRR